MTERRIARPDAMVGLIALVLTAAAGVGFLGMMVDDRYYRLDTPLPLAALLAVAAAVSAFVAAFRMGRAYRRLRVALAVLLTVAAIALCGRAALGFATGSEPGFTEAEEVSPDGRYALVVESYRSMIDSACRVYLQERGGLLSMQAVVWDRVDSGCPSEVRFVDDTTYVILPSAAAPESEIRRHVPGDMDRLANETSGAAARGSR